MLENTFRVREKKSEKGGIKASTQAGHETDVLFKDTTKTTTH